MYWTDDGWFVNCTDARTGKRIYRERIEGKCYASPLLADGRIYYVSRDQGT